MSAESTILRLEAEFDNSPQSIQAVAALLESGCNPYFVAHYRRDEIGDIGEARVFEIAERLQERLDQADFEGLDAVTFAR